MTTSEPWPWPDSLEATSAAPESHRVVFENDEVRVLEVMLPAGHREPEHTHRQPSVMMVLDPAKIRYFAEGELVFESADNSNPVRGRLGGWIRRDHMLWRTSMTTHTGPSGWR